ncbi:MAG: S24/S26 family peptidase [Bacilli bacterium]|nr:S24/S26 family peptidase [Bacilli bacterium]
MEEYNIKKIKFSDISSIVIEGLNNNSKVNLTVTGKSMYPFLLDGIDQIIIEKITHKLKPGDIILYKKNNFIIHRILKKKKNYYIVSGDALTVKEIVFENEIIGYVSSIIKKNKTIDVRSNKMYKIKEMIWRKLFLFRKILLFINRKLFLKQ